MDDEDRPEYAVSLVESASIDAAKRFTEEGGGDEQVLDVIMLDDSTPEISGLLALLRLSGEYGKPNRPIEALLCKVLMSGIAEGRGRH